MKNEIERLKNEFENIKKKGWIKSKRQNISGIGYTFEKLLNIDENSISFADYNGIEIKTKRYNTRGMITLFSSVPDGDNLFSLIDLYENFGYPNREYPNFKSLNISVVSNRYTYLKNRKKIILIVDKEKQKISLDGYAPNLHFTNVSWSFSLIENILLRKLNYLAFIKAESKIINNDEHFYYNKITFYKFKNFNNFLNLIEIGKIRLTIKLGINKTQENFGKMKYHGCSFDINEKDLELLFDKINI